MIASIIYSYRLFNSFSDSLKVCSAITGGTIYYDDNDDFLEMIRLPSRPKVWWLPFTDEAEEGDFINIYSNASFDDSLFATGEPDGGNKQNLLFWSEISWKGNGGAVDTHAGLFYLNSLCEQAKPERNLKLRGLCSSSLINKEYRPTMHPDGTSIVLLGSNSDLIDHKIIIQYSRESRMFILKSLVKMVSAQIDLPPYKSAELFGKHEWTIFNDTGCSTEFSYTKNVSLR